MPEFQLKGTWRTNADNGQLRVDRPDGKFFSVEFDNHGWGQPILVETVGLDGFAGQVYPVVRNNNGIWEVYVTDNDRPGNRHTVLLTEGARSSASNTDPYIDINGLPVTPLDGEPGLSNSARIIGELRLGVVDVTNNPNVSLTVKGENARWVTFDEFSRTTDLMVMGVLFKFMVQSLQLP